MNSIVQRSGSSVVNMFENFKNFLLRLGLAFEEVTMSWSHFLYRILRVLVPLFVLLVTVSFMVAFAINFVNTYGIGILLLSVLACTFIVSVFATAIKNQKSGQ